MYQKTLVNWSLVKTGHTKLGKVVSGLWSLVSWSVVVGTVGRSRPKFFGTWDGLCSNTNSFQAFV
jgi:hypothetical protein